MKGRTAIVALLGILTALSLWILIYYQSQIYASEFGIYLIRDNTSIVSDVDIQYYIVTSRELTLTLECAERLKAMKGTWDQSSGQDPRENPRITQYLERTGRLTR